MHKFGEFVCKYKKAILIIALLLLIPSIIGMKATRIYYDILVYLPSDIETIKGEKILSEDFNMGAFSIIIVDDMNTKDIIKLRKFLNESNIPFLIDIFEFNKLPESFQKEIERKHVIIFPLK